MISGHEWSFQPLFLKLKLKHIFRVLLTPSSFRIKNMISVQRNWFNIKKKGCSRESRGAHLGDFLLDDKSCFTKPHKHTQREVPAYHAPCCKSRTQRRDHHAYRKTPFTCIQSVTGWQNADLNSRAWCLLILESQLSTFPALELPSKRSTFTAHSFLQKAVNELLHRTRTGEYHWSVKILQPY